MENVFQEEQAGNTWLLCVRALLVAVMIPFSGMSKNLRTCLKLSQNRITLSPRHKRKGEARLKLKESPGKTGQREVGTRRKHLS